MGFHIKDYPDASNLKISQRGITFYRLRFVYNLLDYIVLLDISRVTENERGLNGTEINSNYFGRAKRAVNPSESFLLMSILGVQSTIANE